MTRRAVWVTPLLMVVALLAAAPALATPNLKVVASFSVIGDLVKRVAGDDLSVSTIVPAGENVHRWELTPPNVFALEEADIIFYNGFGLENAWLRHIEAIANEHQQLTALAENADFTPLTIPVGRFKGNTDPHMWMDPQGAIAYLEVIAQVLSDFYPAYAEAFQARANHARRDLIRLDRHLAERLEGIPQVNRVLYTSEAGMGYFARAYGFEYAAIWGSNQENMGTAHAMADMSHRLVDKHLPALFYESTVPYIHMDALAREAEVGLAGPLYVDSLGIADGPAYNYPAMLRHDVEVIHEALGGARERRH